MIRPNPDTQHTPADDADTLAPSRPVAEAILPSASSAAHEANTPEPPRLLEIRTSLRAEPPLAEHGFHGMAVLPGAYLIGLAGKIHRDLFHEAPLVLERIAFERPILLSDDETIITARITRPDDTHALIEYFEAASDTLANTPALHPCAVMRTLLSAKPAVMRTLLSAESASHITAQNFYDHLRANGNEYGPHFQTLTDITRTDTQSAARFTATATLHDTATLDATAQLLSAFTLDRGRTFVLRSIERLTFFTSENVRPTRAIATRDTSHADTNPDLPGSVVFTSDDGTPLAEFSGIRLAFIEPPAAPEKSPAEKMRLCVAATFTSEPLEDSLRFWGTHFDREVRVEFAPYNQVFQQLLDPASAFRHNREGINVLALALGDWLHGDHRALPAADATQFGNRSRHTLPNGLEIAHLNTHETEYVYHEIFVDESYLRHGIELADDATVIDVGANIGLFSLFVMSRCQSPTIYAFEPSPRTFDVLRANCAAYGAKAHAFNCGVAEARGTAEFTFYEHSSVFSSFHPDATEDRAAVEAVARNVLENELRDSSAVSDADVAAITAHRLDAQKFQCPLTSVSDIIRDHGITRIHLLKIDAEKSELGILHGIADEHWPLIEQLVIEVHDRTRSAVNAVEQMLTQRGFHCAIVEEKLLEHSGLFNIYARRSADTRQATDARHASGRAGFQPAAPGILPGASGVENRPSRANLSPTANALHDKAAEFCTALDTFAAAASNPLILALTPPATANAALDAAESEILARAARHPHIRCITSREILAKYPVRELHDAHSHQLGHMPFTPEGYAALGTAISRAIFSATAPQVKVIVLDCDNTLWQGLAAEDGPNGIAITPPFKRLQEFMIAQSHAGLLLALCSKNQEADVVAVFDQRDDMPLRRDHLAGWRINWEPKPDNLRSLAEQLNVGLDTFVFLDDNPVECAAVRAACPEVITLQLPSDHERIPAFLDSLWILDRSAATKEDRERGEWYRANAGREELRDAAPTLRDFLDSLQLRIETTEATGDQIPRIAQLTQRTNQFNLTTVRRSESELRDFLKSGARCLITTVSDRFGDYGLVGATLHTTAADLIVVDTMLLSCRALGKGVEHRMLSTLAEHAQREGKSTIELPYRRTDRNEPARTFLSHLAATPDSDEFKLTLPAASLASLRYEPGAEIAAASDPISRETKQDSSAHRVRHDHSKLSIALQHLGEELCTIESVVAAMESDRIGSQQTNVSPFIAASAPAGTLEQSLTAIWKKALGRAHIGVDENFFDAGGTSLKAVIVVAAIRRELHPNVSIITLFECPTIKLLAARLDGSDPQTASTPDAASDAESRGKQRRNKLIKRRTA